MDTFSAQCFAYFKQSGNHAHAHALAPHWGSAAADDMKTPTNKLEFSILMKASHSRSVFCHEISTILFVIVIAE